ncbi:hypothetical protein SUGI_0736430 [Cryptomeria japonica]|nr:hypothetical protein SUGI_0736430 [Cryptomeria japonica]
MFARVVGLANKETAARVLFLHSSSGKPNDHTSGSVSLSFLLKTFSNNGGIVDGNPPMNGVDHPLMIDCPKMPNNHRKGKDDNLSSCTQKEVLDSSKNVNLDKNAVVDMETIKQETLHKHPHREEEICDVNAAGIDIEKEPRDENACMKEYKKGKMIFSLWAVSPKRQGGLGFTTSQVGVVLAISGLALFVFQITTFPPLAKLFGPIHVTRTSAIISIPLLTAYPFIALLRDRALWIIINCASSLKYIFCVSDDNAVTRDQRAAANGLQMSAMSLFKTIGPAAAGILFHGDKRDKIQISFQVHI